LLKVALNTIILALTGMRLRQVEINSNHAHTSVTYLHIIQMKYHFRLSVQMSVVLSGYSGFLHHSNWSPWYSCNIAESGIHHQKSINQSVQMSPQYRYTQTFLQYMFCSTKWYVLFNLYVTNVWLYVLLVVWLKGFH